MTQSVFDLAGRIVVVTGGRGQLGRQYTAALLECGARVVVIDLPGDWSEEFSDKQMTLAADVTNRSDMERALEVVIERWGQPWGLINNAALDSPPDSPPAENGPVEHYPEGSWDKVMEVNLKGTFVPCQVFGGAMARNGGGSIVNISSIYGVVSPDQRIYEYRRTSGEEFYKPIAYSVSKSGVLNLTRYLATYWAKQNLRVNTLTLAGVYNNQDTRFLEPYCERVPMGRMARENEYNGAVVFLLSDASSYMTGSNLVIDGGWTAW
jgi:NAD(P)-dependent dehydrogenase (short-subunit alcohol dehydrogenase family)